MAKRRSNSSNTLWLITAILIIAVSVGLYYLKKQGQTSFHRESRIKNKQHSQLHPSVKPLQQKQQFDFYNVLSQPSSSAIRATPQATAPTLPNRNIKAAKQPIGKTKYYLQVASLKNYKDADALKANLILQGYNVTIAKVTLGQEVRYRINVGPYADVDKAQTAQATLRSNKTNSILVRM